jgi:hypothetical protein
MLTGYKHPSYAKSLSEWGKPRELPQCGGWVLERPIPGFSEVDAMGCYPLFCCEDWSNLKDDLDAINDDLVSLSLVTDPFGDYDTNYLRECFPDLVMPFKTHYVIDLTKPLDQIGTNGQRKTARRAMRKVQVEVCEDPSNFLERWSTLYHHLIVRHQIKGIRAFSKSSFAKQFNIPGAVILNAKYEGEIIASHILFIVDDVAQGHLAALHPIAYKVGATYALDYFAFEYFADKVHWLDQGGGAGIQHDKLDGLSQYKQRWATDTRQTYFCGRIYKKDVYEEIVKANRIPKTNYFPAYRKGEFG